MENSTTTPIDPRPEITPDLAAAFDDMGRAVERTYGLDHNTVNLTILRGNARETNEEEFFYAQHSF